MKPDEKTVTLWAVGKRRFYDTAIALCSAQAVRRGKVYELEMYHSAEGGNRPEAFGFSSIVRRDKFDMSPEAAVERFVKACNRDIVEASEAMARASDRRAEALALLGEG